MDLTDRGRWRLVSRLLQDEALLDGKQGSIRISENGITPLRPNKRNQPLLNYEVQGSLGSGDYAEVFQVKHRKDGAVYAVKTCDNRRDREQTHHEVIATLCLTGRPNTVRLKKVLVDADRQKTHLIMEVLRPTPPRDSDPFDSGNFRSLAFKDVGVVLTDRRSVNVMRRGSTYVQIDYGLCDFDSNEVLTLLAHKAGVSRL